MLYVCMALFLYARDHMFGYNECMMHTSTHSCDPACGLCISLYVFQFILYLCVREHRVSRIKVRTRLTNSISYEKSFVWLAQIKYKLSGSLVFNFTIQI